MKTFMIAGTSSGCGKSTVAMGVNRLLYRKGYTLQCWKCGPDYIDPGFHSLASHGICRNLDTRLMERSPLISLFHHHGAGADLCPVEGVMGYYDGDAGRYDEGSSYDLSKTLGIPVIIVIDASSAAQSVGATALGFQKYREDAPIAGYILNRTGSGRHASMVRDAVEAATGLPVIGEIPKTKDIELPSRHLGLKMATEAGIRDEVDGILERLADLMEAHLDLDRLIELSRTASPDQNAGAAEAAGAGEGLEIYTGTPVVEESPIIAVARDDAFSFYYQDNLDLLKDRGARLAFFSPVHDKKLPEGCSAVYFGGGYPERFARELSENRSMMGDIRRAAEDGMPVYGECGGYMYLAESLRTRDGELYRMAGLLPGEISMTSSLKALGYGTVSWRSDNFLAPAGTEVPGHLFHWSCLENAVDQKTVFSMDRKGEILLEGYNYKNVLASYVHFHFISRPELAENFVRAAAAWKMRGQ